MDKFLKKKTDSEKKNESESNETRHVRGGRTDH